MLAIKNRSCHQADRRWQIAFENSAIGITMAEFTGRFFAVNNAFSKMLGYTEAELCQLTFIDITYEQDRKVNRDLVRELEEGKRQHFQIEKRYRRKDGSLVWARTNVALVPGTDDLAPFWFGIVEDVSRRKQVEEELGFQIEILQNIPAVAWTVTTEGRCDFINEFFLDATGMSREYIQSDPYSWNKNGNELPPLFSWVHPEERERIASLFWDGIRHGEGWAFEAQHFHASDGTYHWYYDRAVPLRDPQGNIVRFVGTCTDIESLKLAQHGLRESEIRQQAFLENSPNLIFLKDREGRYLYVNKECKRALCISDDKILGRRDNEIFSPEQAAAFLANDRQVLEAGVPMEFEEVAVQEDGPHTNIVQKFPMFNTEGKIYAIGGIVTDITERKRAEKELLLLRDELTAELTAMTRLQEFSTELLAINEFHLLLERVLDTTINLQNADCGTIQLYDPVTQALEITGQRGFRQDFLEYFKSVRDTGAACGRAMQLRERVIVEDVETDPEYAPHRHIAVSAGYRAVQSTPLFSRGGELLGILSTHFRKPHRPSRRDLRFTDLYARYAAEIIERRQLETARRQVEEALQITRAQLARVSRVSSMGELAASIAHEVNQPLTAVINNSNACLRLLADHNLEPEVLTRALLEIVADSTRASAVIARIRAFIKKAPAERNELNVNELIQEVLTLTNREFSEHEVMLERELTDPLPQVMGDRVQLQQVLLNLFMNGAEAMSPVTNRPRILRVQSRVDEFGDVLIAVRDSGTGLDMDGDRVFGPLFTTKANGIGMGLTISRSIIEAHGGRLWTEPNFPEGAAFCFTLPVAAGGSS
jgi:PAS domain S-box-containing protein